MPFRPETNRQVYRATITIRGPLSLAAWKKLRSRIAALARGKGRALKETRPAKKKGR
jgi:hypothetical protein